MRFLVFEIKVKWVDHKSLPLNLFVITVNVTLKSNWMADFFVKKIGPNVNTHEKFLLIE